MKTYFERTYQLNIVLLLFIAGAQLANALAAILNANVLNSLLKLNLRAFGHAVALEIGAWLLFSVLLYAQQYLMGVVIQKMSLLLRQDIMRQLSRRPYAVYHEESSDTYGSWLTNDITMIEEQGFKNVYSVAKAIVGTLVSVAVLLTYHWSLVLLTFILSAVTTGLPQLLSKQMARASVETARSNERFLSGVHDLLAGFDTLFSFDKTAHLVTGVTKYGQALATAKIRQNTINTTASIIGVIANVSSQILTMAWTGVLALQKLTTVGATVSTSQLASTVYNGVANLGTEFNAIRSVQPILAKYHLNAVPQHNSHKVTNNLADTGLVIRQLTFTYDQQPALGPVDLRVPAASKAAITGDSGVGKSTLLNILAGKLSGYQGSVKIGGQELKNLSLAELHRMVLYIDQIPYVFNDTIRENVTLGDPYSDKPIWAALKESDLADFVAAQPQGLDTPVGENGRLFSGGQRQRLALARGLLRHKKVLLIDEGTNSLSHAAAISVENQFLQLPDTTVLFVTHQLHQENRQLFDQVLQLQPATA
ncbi:ATP-binding cassette domain-containing protein [Schleiferilactobacillus shenzhenensis]|nr:ABC transporter ATP-binding protein [Schleiferilactobacillus shenzhenensis]